MPIPIWSSHDEPEKARPKREEEGKRKEERETLLRIKRRIETAVDAVFTAATTAQLDEDTKDTLGLWKFRLKHDLGLESYDKLNKALLQEWAMQVVLLRIGTLAEAIREGYVSSPCDSAVEHGI
ncbi:hypothetical protein JCM3766R1_003765 [Sporobolomyces carnicolor]